MKLDYRTFKDEFDPFAEDVSRRKNEQFSDRLKSYVNKYANDVIVPYLSDELARLPMADRHTVEVEGGGEKVWLTSKLVSRCFNCTA